MAVKNKIPNKFYDRAILCRVIKTFKDNGITIIVFRHWSRYNQKWIYTVLEDYAFYIKFDVGLFTIKKHPKYLKIKLIIDGHTQLHYKNKSPSNNW